jgi:predicted nucleic acid-binding protein
LKQELHLLSKTGQVCIPASVSIEIQYLVADWQPPQWIQEITLKEQAGSQADSWVQAGILDRGEADAIALAVEIKADWFLTDDAAARLVGKVIGLEVHGSLGLILWASAVGHLNRSKSEVAIRNLAQSSLWVSPRIIDEAEKALDKIFQS